VKKRVLVALATAALGAGIVGGMSSATAPRTTRCALLHAQAQHWHDAAASQTNPDVAARFQKRGDLLEAQAEQCDARGATTSTSAP
jgi:hypothetical protein